jgi:putative heme transporter
MPTPVRKVLRVILPAISAVVMVVLLALLPRIAGTAWSSVPAELARLDPVMLAPLALLWICGLACNSVALSAALPGLTVRRALALSLSGSAVANVLPLGGAAGMSLNYVMIRRWGFSRAGFVTYTVVSNIWDVGSKLVVGLIAGVVLLRYASPRTAYHGALALVVAIVLLVLAVTLLVHQPSAIKLGKAVDRLAASCGRLIGRPGGTHLRTVLPRLSAMVVAVGKRGWWRLTLGTGAYAALQVFLLYACLDTVGIDLSIAALAGGYAADRLLALVPVTPGASGSIEAGMVAVLTALGVPPASAIAGVLLYRGFTYVAEIPVGGVTAFVWWFGRRLKVAPALVRAVNAGNEALR